MNMKADLRKDNGIQALTFDVFGTVVDYRRSIISLGETLSRETGVEINWPSFADAWRGQYRPSMDEAMSKASGWKHVDEIYRDALKKLSPEYGLDALPYDALHRLSLVWGKLTPWGDSVPGLERLKTQYIIAPLSNGNIRLLTDMAKYAQLPWDLIFSAELCGAYKPDPRTYNMALDYLRLKPEQLMMVAAHADELRAARDLGIKTALILRPLEHGLNTVIDMKGSEEFDLVVNDLTELAEKLGV